MIISFRIRLFAIAGLIVAAVLFAVMGLSGSRMLAYEHQLLDGRLCMEARRLATQRFARDDLQRLKIDIIAKLGLSDPDDLVLELEVSDPRVGGQFSQVINRFAFDSTRWQPAENTRMPDLLSASPERPDRPDRPDRPPPRHAGEPMKSPSIARAPPGVCALASFESQGRQWRGARFGREPQRSIVMVDVAATEVQIHGALISALKLVIPLAIGLTSLGAWLLSMLTMRPVNRLRIAMQDVTQSDLNRRLSTRGEDREFKELIDAYNTMLARLEVSFQQASRFSADAAHELKTPLTILQGRLEHALQKAQQPAPAPATATENAAQVELTLLLDEVGRLSTITRKLLLLSQADAGWLALQRTPIDLTRMLDDLATDAHMLLTDQNFAFDLAPDLVVQGDVVLLRQLFNNLLSNAVRYCRSGGDIRLTARRSPVGVKVVFSNATDTIFAPERSQLFDRFYRGEVARNRQLDGHGLGLSLAREIARGHGGELVLLDTALDEVRLQVTLP